MFHLVSLYSDSAGPRLILFSQTTSKPLIRSPSQAYIRCLFASGYLLAKVARKGEHKIPCFGPAPSTGFCSTNAQADQLQITEADLSLSHLGGSWEGWLQGWRAKAAGQIPLLHISSPYSTNSKKGCTPMCASCGSAACRFICIDRLKSVTVLRQNSAIPRHSFRG